MGEGYKIGSKAYFKAYLTIQANPNIKVTAKSARATYEGTTNAKGVLSLIIKKKGTYIVTSADNSTGASVTIAKSGQTYSTDIVVTMPLSAFNVATYSSKTACCYWTKPSKYVTGIIVRRNTGSYPALSTGTLVHEGNGSAIQLTSSSKVTGVNNSGLTVGTTYYYRAWGYYDLNGKRYYTDPIGKTYAPVNVVGDEVTITSTKNWTVPTGWRTMKVFGVGGGGGGQGGGSGGNTGRGGGGGGYTKTSGNIAVTPGTSYSAQIGSGGAGSTSNANASDGGATKLGDVFTVNGGQGGRYGTGASRQSGGNGGSGGGANSFYSSSGSSLQNDGRPGGSNGSSGGSTQSSADGSKSFSGGTGQGTTTRSFGESAGSLFAGGGGGGGHMNHPSGSGGEGGGGAGGSTSSGSGNYAVANAGKSGGTNTGGGGGGGYKNSYGNGYGGAGGSGILIIRCVA